MNKKKNNYLVIFAFILPIALIAVVYLSTVTPSFFVNTDYNFVYALCDVDGRSAYNEECSSDFNAKYIVEEGKLVDRADAFRYINPTKTYKIRFFKHDTSTNVSEEISYEEAQNYNFSDLLTSPDGVTYSRDRSNSVDFLFFYESSSLESFIKEGRHKKKMDLINDGGSYYNYNGPMFVGWIISE